MTTCGDSEPMVLSFIEADHWAEAGIAQSSCSSSSAGAELMRACGIHWSLIGAEQEFFWVPSQIAKRRGPFFTCFV